VQARRATVDANGLFGARISRGRLLERIDPRANAEDGRLQHSVHCRNISGGEIGGGHGNEHREPIFLKRLEIGLSN